MLKPDRKPDVVNAESLNKFIMGMITTVKTKETAIEEAEAVSKLADKIIKLNLVRLMYAKAKNQDIKIDFFEPIETMMLPDSID